MTDIFYIYHVPGHKFGCTNNIEKRARTQRLKEEDYQIFCIIGDPQMAGDVEMSLNIAYGYPPNRHYMQTLEALKAITPEGAITEPAP